MTMMECVIIDGTVEMLGNVAEIQKISYETPRSIYGETSNE